MSTTCPAPFPIDGKRPLTHERVMEYARAVSHQVPEKFTANCDSRIQVGIFFDGTNNNMKLDFDDLPPDQRRHTNIVKLYQAFPYAPTKGTISYYIPGVGTPFPEIGDASHPDQPDLNWGSTFGVKGEHRILWAMCQVVNAPHEHVMGAKNLLIQDSVAKSLCTTLVGYDAQARRANFSAWQDKLKAALRSNLPKVVQINLSVFGFSRGAAEARAFVNWLLDVCERRGSNYFFAGMELNVAFMGLFDTVASVGLANLFDTGTLAGHQGWADNSLEIPAAVRRCVHHVAAHEVRACFPLDSVRVKSRYPSNAVEVMYPGAHADVGGGYAPRELGMGPRVADNLSIIPGRDMYEAARIAGVPLTHWDKLPDYVVVAWTPSEELIKAYNGYLKACGVGPAAVEQMHRQHMALHHSYRYKWRQAFSTRAMAFKHARSTQEKNDLRTVQARFLQSVTLGLVDPYFAKEPLSAVADRLQAMHKAAGIQTTVRERSAMAVARSIEPERVTTEIEYLFDWFVHDSMAGFKDKLDEFAANQLGAAKFRTVFKGND